MKVIQHQTSRATRGKNLTIAYSIHDFPTGKILVAQSAQGICWLGINCDAARLKREWKGANFIEDKSVTAKAAKEIARLWPSKMEKLSIPLVLYGTEFQLKVWKELLKIKSGKTTTYESIAKKIGKPKAVRAVGSAVGKNTISIVVPCHRVVNKTGTKISFGWGPAMKLALLKGEKAA